MGFFKYINEEYSVNNPPDLPVYRGEDAYVFFTDDSDDSPIEIDQDGESYRVINNIDATSFEFPKKSCDLISNELGVFLIVHDNSKWINSGNNMDVVENFIELTINSIISGRNSSKIKYDDVDFFLSSLRIDTGTPVDKSKNFRKLQNGELCKCYLDQKGENVRKVHFYKNETSPAPFLRILCGNNKYSVESECSHGRYSEEHKSMSDLNSNPVLRYLIDGKLENEQSILDKLEYYFKENSRSENFDFVRSLISETMGEDMIDPSFYKR